MTGDDGLFLDHVAVVIPDLARAGKTYERLGFRPLGRRTWLDLGAGFAP